MDIHALADTALALVGPGKGILAADESTGTIARRFAAVGIPNTAETRRAYRTLLATAPGVERHLGGAILYDETMRQATDEGEIIPAAFAHRGIVPGIKVDLSTVPLAGCPGEKVTAGLDGLRERLAEYHALGARFAKWRAVLAVGPGLPSEAALVANTEALARYAALCQEAMLVPMVEPEVLMDGDHPIEACHDATERALLALFTRLRIARVALEGVVLKVNMVVPGERCARQATVDEVADATVRCLRACVPASVAGIAFLSGGQSPEIATHHLDAIAKRGPHPWPISFSYGRALQEPVQQAWRGDPANVAEAQRQLLRRARLNALARDGAYAPAMEMEDAAVP